jgi:hypothetical protein
MREQTIAAAETVLVEGNAIIIDRDDVIAGETFGRLDRSGNAQRLWGSFLMPGRRRYIGEV